MNGSEPNLQRLVASHVCAQLKYRASTRNCVGGKIGDGDGDEEGERTSENSSQGYLGRYSSIIMSSRFVRCSPHFRITFLNKHQTASDNKNGLQLAIRSTDGLFVCSAPRTCTIGHKDRHKWQA